MVDSVANGSTFVFERVILQMSANDNGFKRFIVNNIYDFVWNGGKFLYSYIFLWN